MEERILRDSIIHINSNVMPRNVGMTLLFVILTILYYKNASFRSYSTFVHFFVRISSYKYAYLRSGCVRAG